MRVPFLLFLVAAGAGGAEAWLVASGHVHAVASMVMGTLASGAPAEIIASPFTAAAASFRGFLVCFKVCSAPSQFLSFLLSFKNGFRAATWK